MDRQYPWIYVGTGICRSAWLQQQSTEQCQRASAALLTYLLLQSVQNAAARFITITWKYDHITPVLLNLHWLPVRQRITFSLMYRCLNGLTPSYLAADSTIISAIPGRKQLRSESSRQLYIPRTRVMIFGPRSFKFPGPTIWNDHPSIIIIIIIIKVLINPFLQMSESGKIVLMFTCVCDRK